MFYESSPKFNHSGKIACNLFTFVIQLYTEINKMIRPNKKQFIVIFERRLIDEAQ